MANAFGVNFPRHALTLEKEGFFPHGDEVHGEMKEIGNFSYIYYSITSLNPDNGFLLYEPLLLPKTQFEVPLEVRDGSKLVANINLALEQDITISATDQMNRDYGLTVQVVDTQTEQELIDKAAHSVREELNKKRASLSFPLSWFGSLESKAYIAFAKPTLIAENDGMQFNQVEFKPETVKQIVVYDHSRTRSIWLSLMVVLTIAAGLILVSAFLRLKRKTKQAVAVP